MVNNERHLFSTKTEGAKQNLDYKLDCFGLLLDLKVLMKEYYAATFTDDGNALVLSFSNGQKFRLTLSEIN